MINRIKLLGLVAAVTLAPTLSSALTLTIDDLGTAGVDITETGPTDAIYGGTAGNFTVGVYSGISSVPGLHTLDATSIQLQGVGTLQITTEQTGLSGFSTLMNFVGSASVTNIGQSVTVEHMVNLGLGGGWQTIGDVLSFAGGTPGAVNLSDATSERLASVDFFDLRSILTVVTDSSDQSVNVNSTLTVAPVPVPAAGLLLLTALGGIGIARRRKKA